MQQHNVLGMAAVMSLEHDPEYSKVREALPLTTVCNHVGIELEVATSCFSEASCFSGCEDIL